MYATLAQLEERYGADEVLRASDRDGDGVADSAAVARALEDASEEIDGYLARRYALPLATVPGVVARLCSDIAMYRLSVDAGAYTEEKRTRYEDAVRMLKGLASGDIILPGAAGNAPSATEIGVVETTGARRRFKRSQTGGIL